jgi:peptide/nickel transport system substrate-binding protein
MTRKLSSLLAVALIVTLLAASLPAVLAQGEGNTLIMARAVDSTGLDPHTQTAFASLTLLNMIYEPLVRTDHELNVVPALAEDWEFADDAMTLTFYLREGVKFHDGSDLTAEDVIASYERILDEETGSAARTNYLSIESMDAPDDLTVVFNLSTPDVPLLSAMTSTNAAIMPAELAAGDPAAEAIGTGPFKLDSWTPDEVTMLSANEDWWGEGPFVDGVEMRIIPDEASILAALRAGTIDFAMMNDPLVATLLIDDANVTLARTPALSYHVLQLRAAANEELGMLAVRQAISCAIDRQEVVDTATLGEGRVTGPLTMASYSLPLEDLFCYEKDLDKARELMAEAGLEDGFTLNVMVANAEPPTALSEAQSIQAQLAEINITVEIEPLELSVYVDRWLAADFEAAVALNGGRIDPYTMYARYWQYDARFQDVAGYIDDDLDALMKAGQAETDPDARYEIFVDLQQQLAEKAPWIWMYAGYTYTAHQSTVEGWEPIANDTLYYLHEVTLNR